MSIAIPTYAPGSITSYSELVTELRDMLDDLDYSQPAIDRALRKAEAQFNRVLRVPAMEAVVLLNATTETIPLPTDFLQMRGLYSDGSPDRTLMSVSPASLTLAFGGQSGTPLAYAVEGRSLRIAPVGTTSLMLLYYAAIPALSDAQVSNWLLERHPDLYVAGGLYHLARRERDREGMAQAGEELLALLASVNQAGQRARWGAGPLTPMGMAQVRGARA